MFLISQDRLKALDMSDIKGYFVHRGGKFDKSGAPSDFGYVLMANTAWTNYNGALPECHQWIIGEFATLEVAVAAMETITSIKNVGGDGRVYVDDNGIRTEHG